MSDAPTDAGDAADAADAENSPPAVEAPADPLAVHPATAYFWGHVAGSGTVSDDGIEVVANDERSARVLSAVVGGDVGHDAARRPYTHDTSISRTEDEYTLSIEGSFGREGVLGLPVDGRGGYRLETFTRYDRELLRGLLEGCGTICFKSSSGTVGVSFVHDDRGLLERIRGLIDDCPVDAPVGGLAETSSGGYWFGVDDAAAPAFGTWLYEDCAETGLYAPTRKRKLERSLDQARAYE